MTTITEAIAQVPTEAKVLLQFNKVSGALTAVLGWVDPATLNNDFYVYAEHDGFDFQNQEVRGTYPNYEVVNRIDADLIYYESQMDLAAQQKITKRYPVINQVNKIGNAIENLGRVVLAMSGENPDPALVAALAELDEMNDYITEVKQANDTLKEYYAKAEGYIYVSLEQEANDVSAQLEGGLHEVYGAKQISGGTVF
jgi:hypothetical protein